MRYDSVVQELDGLIDSLDKHVTIEDVGLALGELRANVFERAKAEQAHAPSAPGDNEQVLYCPRHGDLLPRDDDPVDVRSVRCQEAHTVTQILDSFRRTVQGEPTDAPYPQVDAFAERMRAELVANAHKGDHWQNMTVRQAWGEISWHVGKMTCAIKSGDLAKIRELAADIANGAMMLDEIVTASAAAREEGQGHG